MVQPKRVIPKRYYPFVFENKVLVKGLTQGGEPEASAPVVAAGLAFRLAPKKDAGRKKNRRDDGIGQSKAQVAMVHGQRGIQEPDRCAEIPDPVEISAHLTLGCAACCGRYLLILMVKMLTRKTPRVGGLFRTARRSSLTPNSAGRAAHSFNRNGQRRAFEARHFARSAARSAESRQISLQVFLFPERRQRFPQNLRSARVRGDNDPVVHPFALAPRSYHTRPTEISEVPRDLRLALPENFDEIADADLATVHQIQQTKPRAIRKRREQ